MEEVSAGQSPGTKLVLVILVAFLLSIPLFAVWLLVYDREQQSQTALSSIAEGWGGPQILSGPELVIPYRAEISEITEQDGRPVTRTVQTWRELSLAPESLEIATRLDPERRTRSIYEAVVYLAETSGRARFTLPADLERQGVDPATLTFDRAELRFGLSDMRGVQGAEIRVAGVPVTLQSGAGEIAGFSALVDASAVGDSGLETQFSVEFRGNQRVSLDPLAGETEWTVTSSWPHPSFQGGFLPSTPDISADGFTATYRITNLALGRSLVVLGDESRESSGSRDDPSLPSLDVSNPAGAHEARVSLHQPVDLYSRVDRSVKYGFLIIGFTFLAFLMFDVIAGVAVSTVEYLLVGVALVLFFVLLLAFAEIIGFAWAFIVAAGAIIGLTTSYSAAVLASWRRAGFIGALLVGLYAVMFVLLSLETYSLLIGSLLLFVALAVIMYATRNLNWGGDRRAAAS